VHQEQCPKCQFDHPLQTTECLRCGIVFSKYAKFQEAVAAVAPALQEEEKAPSPERALEQASTAKREFLVRAVALPAALLVGWLTARGMPALAAFLQMWTHESGHAVTAWFCGYPALPTAWMSLLLGAVLAFGGYVAWRKERRFWVVMSAIGLALLAAGNLRSDFQSRGLIIFGGDAGSFVIATVLMATFYARADSAMVRQQLRWGLLVLGAIAFMFAYGRWAGGFEEIVHWLEDTDERGPSDLQQLTQMYGWAIGDMQARFLRVAYACWVALAAMYAVGLVQARQRWRAVQVAAGR
jgi:hypothetical protein